MDNKLSELSKPVQIFKHPSGRNFWSVSADSNAGHQGVEPFYSQEYVSSLLAEIERGNGYLDDVRYAKECCENAIAVREKRIAELEAKLATPVPVPSFDCYKPDVARELQEGFKNTVRAAGFTVEGDE